MTDVFTLFGISILVGFGFTVGSVLALYFAIDGLFEKGKRSSNKYR